MKVASAEEHHSKRPAYTMGFLACFFSYRDSASLIHKVLLQFIHNLTKTITLSFFTGCIILHSMSQKKSYRDMFVTSKASACILHFTDTIAEAGTSWTTDDDWKGRTVSYKQFQRTLAHIKGWISASQSNSQILFSLKTLKTTW